MSQWTRDKAYGRQGGRVVAWDNDTPVYKGSNPLAGKICTCPPDCRHADGERECPPTCDACAIRTEMEEAAGNRRATTGRPSTPRREVDKGSDTFTPEGQSDRSEATSTPEQVVVGEAAVVLDTCDVGYEMVPLPSRKKNPPPAGTTGYRGVPLTRGQIAAYVASTTTPRAWAIRLGSCNAAVDVDAYKDDGAAFQAMIEEYGPLPPTVMSTARSDGISGIRLYSVTEGTFLRSNPAATVEIIQWFHRFVIVAPSTHTKLGTPYRFIDEATGEVLRLPPPPGELPELPQSWIDGLASSAPKGRKAERCASADEIVGFVASHNAARAPGLLRIFRERLARERVGSRHDTLVTVACWAMREAAAGLYPAAEALGVIESWWADVMDDVGRRDGVELPSAVSWAIAEVEADPERVAATRERFENWRRSNIAAKNARMTDWIARSAQ